MLNPVGEKLSRVPILNRLHLMVPQLCKAEPFNLAQYLVVGILITSTRWFALTSLFEALLLLLIICSSHLRSAYSESLKDVRVLLSLCFVAWVSIAMSWGVAPYADRLEELWSWRKLLLVPAVFMLFKDVAAKKRMNFVFILTCAGYMVGSWLGYLGFVSLDRDPAHFLENHSTQGVFFSVAALMCLVNLKRSKLNVLGILGYLLLIIGFVTNILMVLTGKSSFVFLISVLFAAGMLIGGKYARLLAILLVVTGMIFLASVENTRDRLSEAINQLKTVDSPSLSDGSSMGLRVVMWRVTLKMIADKPFLGTGSGSYKYDYANHINELVGWQKFVSDNPHQQYMHIWAEQGIIGLVIFLCAIISWAWRPPDLPKSYYWMAIGILIGTSLNGFANGHFSSFSEGRLFWILMPGLLSSEQTLSLANLRSKWKSLRFRR